MPRILIVDDQRDVRQVLRAGLETLGPDVRVTDVPSGEEAMLVLARDAYDLLVVDVRLPGISGLELRAWAQVKNPDLKLVVITGTNEPKVRQQVMEAPVAAYFFKPISMTEFLASAEVLLSRGSPAVESAPVQPTSRPAPVEDPPLAEKTRPWRKSGAREPAASQAARDARPEANGLVFSAHDPEKKRQQAQNPDTMATRLGRLHKELEAISTLILDETGQVVARAGVLPDARLEDELLANLSLSLRVNTKTARLIGGKPDSFLALRGAEYDLFLAPLGESWGLMAATPPQEQDDPECLAEAAACMKAAAGDLLSILGEKHIPPALEVAALPEAQAPAAPEPETEMPDLDDLFGSGPVIHQDVDAFWNTLVEAEGEHPLSAKAISYDRAVELGLAAKKIEE